MWDSLHPWEGVRRGWQAEIVHLGGFEFLSSVLPREHSKEHHNGTTVDLTTAQHYRQPRTYQVKSRKCRRSEI